MRSLLASCWLLLAVPAAAETIDLVTALREAVANRPLVAAAREEAAAARAGAGEVRSRLLPRLTLSERFVATNEPATGVFILLNQERLSEADMVGAPDTFNDPPSRRDFETRLQLEQVLFDAGLVYEQRRARRLAGAAEAAARWSAEQAAFAAFEAYLQVQAARAAADWVASSQQEAEEIVRLSRLRHEAGLGLRADLLRAEVFLAEAQRRRVAAGNDLLLSRRFLALTLGRAAGEVDIAAPLTPADLGVPHQPAPPLRRPDLQALDLQAEAADLARRQSRAAWYPRLAASAAYTFHDREIPFGTEAGSWLVAAGLTWEVFDGGGRSQARQRTAALQRAASAQRDEAARRTALALQTATLRAEEAGLQLQSAVRSEAAAGEALRLLRERYAAGLSELSEVLSTQAALDRVRFEKIGAESRYLHALGNELLQQGIFLQILVGTEIEP